MQPRPKMIFAFGGNGKGAVAVALKKTKGYGSVFGAAQVFAKLPFGDYAKRSFVHAGF